MKILQICNKIPFPPNEGGSIAMNLITEGLLKAGHQVKILAINTRKHFVDINSLPDDYKKNTSIEAVFIDTTVKPLDAFLNLFTSKSYNIERFINSDFEKKIIEIIQSETFDIIQLETLFVCPYIDIIRKYSSAKIVYRAHNVEHIIWKRNYISCKNILKKAYLKLLTNRLKRYEVDVLNIVDGIVAITQADVDFITILGCYKPKINIPVGVYINKISFPEKDYEFPSFFHIGSMNWIPNIEGMKWFISKVWNKFHLQNPNVKFYIAGRHMPDCFKNLESINIINLGEVDNANLFIQSKAVMIVPLLSGGGMRVKIIEGMANAKTIITTTIGAEGINYENKRNILIADTPEEFINAINYCISDKGFINTIGENAKLLIENEYNNEKIISKLVDFYKKIC
jgi:polysaccharide biosynthesis protein PslH